MLEKSFLDFCSHNFRVDAKNFDSQVLKVPPKYASLNFGVYENNVVVKNSIIVLLHSRMMIENK